VVADTGICRLIGHKGVITKLAFMKEHNIIISSSKDTFVKFWDLDTEHNFKTLVGHRSEVSCLITFLLYFLLIIFSLFLYLIERLNMFVLNRFGVLS